MRTRDTPSPQQHLCVSLAWLLLTTSVSAQESVPDSHLPVVCKQEPRCFIALANALETAKTSKEAALRLMLLVYTEFPDPRLCFNIGRLFQQTGNPRDAVKHFRRFLDSEVEQEIEYLAKARGYLQQAEREAQPSLAPPIIDATPAAGAPRPAPTATEKQPATSPGFLIASDTLDPNSGQVVTDRARAKPTCEKWSFARAATLAASAGVLGSGLLGGIMVAAQPEYDPSSPYVFTGRGYSAIGFGVAALALIPGGLALARPDLFSAGGSPAADGTCASRLRSRWSAERGAAVGGFSGLLLSGLAAAITVSSAQSSSCVNTTSSNVISCSLRQHIGAGWGLTGAWALGLTLSLVIPSRSTYL